MAVSIFKCPPETYKRYPHENKSCSVVLMFAFRSRAQSSSQYYRGSSYPGSPHMQQQYCSSSGPGAASSGYPGHYPLQYPAQSQSNGAASYRSGGNMQVRISLKANALFKT